MDVYTISVIGFFAVLALVIYKDRKNIEMKYILFMRRTKRGLELLENIAKYRKFWKVVGTIGVLVALFFMVYGLWNLMDYGRMLITKEMKEPSVRLIFPTPTSQSFGRRSSR